MGSPQGSTLGPLLFIAYINDLPSVLSHTRCSLYADDTAIYCSNQSTAQLTEFLQEDLLEVEKWLNTNKLFLNVKKTKIMLFGSRPLLDNTALTPVKINDEELEVVRCFKYLGLFLDQNLSFSEHISYISTKVSQSLYMLSRTREYMSEKSALTLYCSLILPLISYCDTVFHSLSAKDATVLQTMQNKGLRIVTLSNRWASTDEMHLNTGILLSLTG